MSVKHLNQGQLAERWGVSEATLERWRSEGIGPVFLKLQGRHGGGHQGARAGLTPFEAAATAARYMIEYAQSNPEGGDLMAPPEVLELVPAHLRQIKGERSRSRYTDANITRRLS